MFPGLSIGGEFIFNYVIAANTLNFNLRSAAVAAGWNQIMPIKATVTVNAGVYVGSASSAAYSFDTGSGYPVGSTLKLINNGYIYGRGGDGGQTSNYNTWPSGGANGGPALIASHAIAITNNGSIAGGGGGGGGGCGSASGYNGGGGGGGRGYPGGSGGIGGIGGSIAGQPGGSGTTAAAGAGGSPTGAGIGIAGNGGDGGDLAVSGTSGGAATDRGTFNASPGGPGAAIAGNTNITWTNTGTRLGAIS